ncbi:hypothetical protein [Janthinobacterium agaricidamnosum]|uniref:Uncharacterized protein n=1 Tax=Janthinobacterium agaricidamnosum NBRC 102515 = DSM 9628 TaxID=1349767 RepID=W0V5J4_9BURK|nr:hypothetical protein [Janthinobacterium agaricidamnosum]CDG82875.1 putative uncharacterized protein [Janthinobacterium agaricidamnosum NBRC 102515 = DSM 9628]
MRGLFAMLFGAGVVRFCERLERRLTAAPVADLYLRRCMWLLLFGLIHGALIIPADSLTAGAAAGDAGECVGTDTDQQSGAVYILTSLLCQTVFIWNGAGAP